MPTGYPKNGVNKGWFVKGANKGKKDSPEMRRKKSLAAKERVKKYPHTMPNKPFLKGHVVPQEWREITRKTFLGKPAWNKEIGRAHV